MKVKGGLILFLIVVLIGLTGTASYFGIGQKNILGVEHIRQGLDLKGGVTILYEADKENPTPEEMNAAIALIQGRLDRGNYTEAEVAQEGERRLRVDIPGVKDANKAIEDIGETAQLQFIGPDDSVILTGKDVKDARKDIINDNGITKAIVTLEFNAKGKEAFAKATEKYLGQVIYIKLDGQTISDPVVNSVITGGNAIIEGINDMDQVDKLAARIKAGALPFNLTSISSNSVGAKLGANALDTSIQAGLIGIVIVLLFMLIVYKIPGLAADLALLFYGAVVLVILSLMQSTLTLPGIAGIILSIGMAVDANVIIFSRIKEELDAGKTLRASVDSGFSKAFSAILDGNVTTLIAAFVLYWLGTGLIKSFAQTLGIGILVSMFTALVITRIIIKQFVNLGIKNPKLYGAKSKEA